MEIIFCSDNCASVHWQSERSPFCCCGKNPRRCQPFHRDSHHLVQSFGVKTVAFCSHAEFFYTGTKAQIAWNVGGCWEGQIPADIARPVLLWPCWPDIICLYLALCHSPSVMKRQPLHCCKVETGSLIRHPPVLQIFSLFALVFSPWKLLLLSRVCWTGGGWGELLNWRAELLLSGLGSASCLGWSDSLSWRALHNMMQTLLTDCGAWWGGAGRGGGTIKVFLSFICSFLSLFKAEINQLYTRAHHSLLFPSICLFSSQWSFRLDMHCENLSCSASFFFSFFLSLSLSTVCH